MNLENLEEAKNLIEQQYNNLSNAQWIAQELQSLKGKFDILTEVINNLKGEQDAATQNPTDGADSHHNKRK